MSRKKDLPWIFIILSLISVTALSLLARVDYEWTFWLHDHQIEYWAVFVKQTLFEDGSFGGSDPGIFLQLILGAGFFFSYPGSRFPRLQRYRPYLGFTIFTSLVTGIGLVHGLKWIIGRARPYLIIDKGLPFSHWYEIGPHQVSDGSYFGSLPSGHTATAILMITLSYIMAADRTHSLPIQIMGWIWGVLTLIYATAMAIGRSMTLHHWLSDGFAVIILDWMAIHLIFFFILKVPRQVQYIKLHGRYPKLDRYWELQLLWRVLLVVLAIVAAVFGIKAVIFQKAAWLILLLVPAVPLAVYTSKSLRKAYRIYMAAFKSGETDDPAHPA